ncbi:vacuolar protein sorting 50 [Arctopsyche grandis]|uniref:vacuolar protein sorting 50 n=1 Tax=Arctopsyche grandis TaxID=121162 RepID=UPI00406D7D8B
MERNNSNQLKNADCITINSRTNVGENCPADMEVFKEIDQFYFSSSETVDPGRYVLEKAPFPPDCTAIEEMFMKLKRQQQVVSNKALHLISQKRDACDKEFKEITTVQQQLAEAIQTCRRSRYELKTAKSNLTVSTFAILANFRKKQIVQGVLRSLNTIRNLRQAEDEVQNLMRSREYEAAVRLVLAGQKAASEHRHFKCVASLTQRLQDTLDLAEEQLDVVLASICYNFDDETFTKLQRAYSLLNKTQVAMDQLHMHFASAINNAALQAITVHQKDNGENSNEQLKFKELCANVKESSVVICLLDLCDRLWAIMLSYHHVVNWNTKQNESSLENFEYFQETSDFEINVNREYVREKLKNGLLKIWHDVQFKVKTFLTESDLSQYPFEKFVRVLGILKRLISVGEEFCGDTSDGLQNFIKNRTIAYLKNYHAGRMEVLRIFLENEGWELCPVKSSFNLMHLQEFDKLKRHIKACSNMSSATVKNRDTPISTKTHSSDAGSSAPSDSFYIGRYFTRNSKHTPFHIFRNDSAIDEDILENELDNYSDDQSTDISDDDEPDELKRDFVDETESDPTKLHTTNKSALKKTSTDTIIVTNTALSILRDIGQYLQMCRFLKQVSFEVVMLMIQMFDYYLYSVHYFFASDLKVSSSTLYSAKLNWIIRRVGNNITLSEDTEMVPSADEEQSMPTKYLRPQASQLVNLSNPETLHGLAERIAAVESLLFLSKQLDILQPYLENLIQPHQKIILQTFFEQTVYATVDIRVPIYMCVSSQVFNVRNILISMSQVNWEVKNVMSQHSSYVDQIVRDIQVFSMRLDQVGQKVPVTDEVHRALWSSISKFVVHTLVEGFSNVNKCSDSGRGLMQLDYTQLLSKMEKISGIKPSPFQEYVDVYVKGYYLPQSLLGEFISEHREYSVKHLTALVHCACDSKKGRQELLALIDGRDSYVAVKGVPVKIP